MTAPPGGDVGVGVLEGHGDQRFELPLMKRSPSAAHSLATDAPKRSTGSQRTLDIGGQPARRAPSAERQRRLKGGGGTGPDGLQATTADRKEASSSSETWLRHVASDGNISHVVQLEREMATELAQNAADVAEVPGPRHVKYATVMAKSLRRDSQRASTPELGQGAANTRMTQEERRELARVQREVMWNLQKDEVVTIVRQGDDPVPYKRQGNPAVNTPISVRKRLSLRHKPLIQEIINEYWCFPGLNPEGSDEMTKGSYVELNRKLHLALIPDTTDEDAKTSAEVDWSRDTARWGNKMTKEAFASSMFELADIWTENINEEEYTAFLWLLLETITNTNVVPPSFKPDRDIECIVDEDLSEATNHMRDALADELGRERDSLPLDVDGITALLADKTNKRDTLSPQLKEKYIQRLRTLRKRLQALKELRTLPVPGAANAESSGSGEQEISKESAPIEGTKPDRSQDFRSTTTDSGTIREPSADPLGAVADSGTIRESIANNVGSVAASSGGADAEALGADSLGSAVPTVDVISGAGRRKPGGSDVDRGGGAAGDASSVDRNTAELDAQNIQPGEEGARDADNQHGEGCQNNDVLPRPSRDGALIPGSGERGSREPAAKLSTGELEENMGVSQLENSAGVLGSGRDYLPKGATLSNGLGNNKDVVRKDGAIPADMPMSGGGGAGNGARPTDTRASDRADMGHPQEKAQQQRSEPAADERGNRTTANAGPVSDNTAASTIEGQQDDDKDHPRDTRDVDRGDNLSRKRAKANDDDESRQGGGGDTDNRDGAAISRVGTNEGSNSNRMAQFETGSGVTRGSITEEFQSKNGGNGEGSAGYSGRPGVAPKRQETGNIDFGDINVSRGETQIIDRAGSRNGADERAAGGNHKHSPSNILGTAYGTPTSAHSSATAGPSEAVAADGYGGDIDGVAHGDIDGFQASSAHVASNDLTDNARHIGDGETPYGDVDEVLRERDGTNHGVAPIDHGRRQSVGGYDAVGGGAHKGDIGNEQGKTALISAVDHQRDDDGSRGHGDHNGSEHALTAPAGVKQESTANHAMNGVTDVLDASIGAGEPSQTSRSTSDSLQNSDTTLVKPGDTKYGGLNAVVSIGDGRSRPMQSEVTAERNGEADGEAEGTAVVHGDPGGRRKVSFDVGGPDASPTPTRPSVPRPQGGRGSEAPTVGAEVHRQQIAAPVTAHDGTFDFRPGGSPGGWDGISGTTDEQWESMIGRAEMEKQQRASRSVAGRAAPVRTDSPRPGAQNPPIGGYLSPSTLTDPPGSVRTEETDAVVAPSHSTETQEGLPSVDGHFRGDLSNRQGSDAPGRPTLKRETRSDSIEGGGDCPGLEPAGGHGGRNPDDPSDSYGRVGREVSPTLEDENSGDPLPAVHDPYTMLEKTTPLKAGTRQRDSEQGFDRDRVETRSNSHGVPDNETRYSDSDGLALRPGVHDEDMSGMALHSHVGDGAAEAHARKVSESFTVQGAARTEGEGLVESSTPSEGVLARLQPASDKQNASKKGVFDGDSTALKPQGTSSVVPPGNSTDKGVKHNHTLRHSSEAAGGSASGDDLACTNASAIPSQVVESIQKTIAIDDSLNMEEAETRSPAHPGTYDTATAHPESRKGLGAWSTREHENWDVSSDVENVEVSSGGRPVLERLATHKNAADEQLAAETRAVLEDDYNPSHNRSARPDSTGDAASKGVGSVSELAIDRTSFGGDIGSEPERAVVENVTAADRSTVQTVQGLTERQHSHGNAHTVEHATGDASNLNGFTQSYAEAGSPRSGHRHATHTARRSGGNFAEEHHLEAVGVGIESRMDQSGGDGVSSHLDDSRRQRPRQSETRGSTRVLRRQSTVTENNAVPEPGEGHQKDQGLHRRGSSGGVRKYDDHDQQHRGVVPGTGMPVEPSNRGVYREVFKTGQTKGTSERPGAIAGSCVGETRANRQPRKTTAAAGGAVGERPRKPVRPVVEVPHAVHPRVANYGIAGTAPDGDSTTHVYDVDAVEENGEVRARGVRKFVPATAREVGEDVRRSIAGRKVAATIPTGGSFPHTKPVSVDVAEPATRATGRRLKGGGAAADERGQDIAASISTGAKEDGTRRIPSKQKTSPTTVRPTRHGRISREPYTRTSDASLDVRRPQREQREPEFRVGSLSSKSVEPSGVSASFFDDDITKGKGTPLRADLGRQDHANGNGRPRVFSVHDDHATNRRDLSAREGPHREAVPDRLRPPVSARGEQSLRRGVGTERQAAAYHDDSSRSEHYNDRHHLSTAGNNSGVNGRLLGTKKRISPWNDDSPRDSRETAVSGNERLKIRRAPAPPDSSGRRDGLADRAEKIEAAAARGRGRKGLGAVDERVDMTPRPIDAHHTSQNDGQKGGGHHDTHWITGTTQAAGNGIGSHWSYGHRRNGDENHPQAEIFGDGFNRPPQKHPVRPRTTPASANPQQDDNDQKKLRRLRDASGSDNWRGRSVSLHDREEAGGPPAQSDRDRKASFPSGRMDFKRPEDWRPMLGPLDTPQRGRPWQPASAPEVSVLEGSSPYYVDRKQVWHFIPDLGLPPWRTPAPGEPGWDPILNYCEVKQDEEKIIEDRKRREFLCRRRNQSRGGGDRSSTTGGSSSVEGHDSSQGFDVPNGVSARKRVYESAVPENSEARQDEDDDEGEEEEDGYDEGGGDPGSSRMAIARKVNARRPPATARELKHEKTVNFHDPAGLLVGSPSHVRNPTVPTPKLRKFKPLVHGNGYHKGTTAPIMGEVTAGSDRSEQSTSRAMTAGRPRARSSTAAVAPSHYLRPLVDAGGAMPPNAAMAAAFPSQTRYIVAADVSPHTYSMAVEAPPSVVEGRAAAPVGKRYRHRHMSLSVAQNPPFTNTVGFFSRCQERGSTYYLPWQAKVAQAARGHSYKYRRRSDNSPTRVPPVYYTVADSAAGSASGSAAGSATATPAYTFSSRPYTNVGGSRWSQDVRLQQHARGRSRLAPSTRTAGGRWGANHGRLEGLFPGEKASALHPPDYWERWESAPWVLDVDPSL